MKILSYNCSNIHNYISQSFELDGSCNFLHCINGCGKTTIIKSINALIGNNVNWLFQNKYDLIEIRIEMEENIYKFRATQNSDDFIISSRVGNNKFKHDFFSKQQVSETTEEYMSMGNDENSSLTNAIYELRDHSDNSPLSLIEMLPSPLFLGIERTAILNLSPAKRKSTFRKSRSMINEERIRPNESTHQAETLIADYYRDAIEKREKLVSELRDKLITSIFQFQEQSGNDSVDLHFPAKGLGDRLSHLQSTIKDALLKIGLGESTIKQSSDLYFNNIQRATRSLSKYKDFEDFNSSKSRNIFDLFEWLKYSDRIPVIEYIAYVVDDFNTRESELLEQFKRYTEILNRFLHDSGKNISLGSRGNVQVELPSGSTDGTNVFSSGERQLFVLISHLMFNDSASTANVLVIDEPELSLHIRWQELFVDAILDANPNAQLILATHSPSIINERINKTIEIKNVA